MATSTTDPVNLGLSGLSSGLDTSTIITQLMAINKIPQDKLKLQQSTMQARLSALQSLQTELENLRDKADALRSAPRVRLAIIFRAFGALTRVALLGACSPALLAL